MKKIIMIVLSVICLWGCQEDNPLKEGFLIRSVTCKSDSSAIYDCKAIKGNVGGITSANWTAIDIEGPCHYYEAGDRILLFKKQIDTVYIEVNPDKSKIP